MSTIYNPVTGLYDTTGSAPSVPMPPAASTSGVDSGISMSGLSSLFSSIGTAFAQDYRAVNPTVTPPAGALMYNPATGQYVSPSALATAQATSALSPIIILGLVALGIYLVIRR